jgi:pantoate--beta-alanine ligase
MTGLVQTRLALAAWRAGAPMLGAPGSGPVVLVPTMGALHDGHRALLRTARAVPDGRVVVSVFVNPLQFGPGEDLDRYPRTLDADLAMCADEGADLVFAPSAAEMYPGGQPRVTVDPGPAGQVLEGEFRPGFFGGVLTVVLKLFSLVRPDIAVFGEKDAQQLALIRAMVTDLDLGLSITGVPTVRDPDGLAMSSRNKYLSAAQRATALAVSRALRVGGATASDGPMGVLGAARSVLDGTPGLSVDYLALVDPETFIPVDGAPPGVTRPALLAAAVRVGTTRLIDNMLIEELGGGPNAADD